MKTFTTGQVAKICGFKSARVVARMFDRGKIGGHLVQSRLQRRSCRRIPLNKLLEFMRINKISLDGFDGDIKTQQVILYHQTFELKKAIVQAKKRSGVFSGFKGLPDALLHVIDNLGLIDSLSGASEDRQRVLLFRNLVDLMEFHIALRCRIVTSKK